jgi:imidazolonepropionase-like amidohydrolase
LIEIDWSAAQLQPLIVNFELDARFIAPLVLNRKELAYILLRSCPIGCVGGRRSKSARMKNRSEALSQNNPNRSSRRRRAAARLPIACVCVAVLIATAAGQRKLADRALREVNALPRADASRPIVIRGATLVDGRGGAPVRDAVVVVRGERIAAVGARGATPIPVGAQIVDAAGMTLLPGLIDAHFHLEDPELPATFLRRGVTSVRDPGQWVEAYDGVRRSEGPIPRLFLSGPHLDTAPPAYPRDAVIVRDAEETRLATLRNLEQGASVIKVYFRLPLELIRVATGAAHARGVPVTAHLEIVDASDAIRAGIDGIEHITSLGPVLLPRRDAEIYRQAVLADNNARREGRYRVWSQLDFDSPRARGLLALLVERGVFLSPTLAVFERRPGDRDTNEMHVRGFQNMVRFTGMAKRAGARVVVGSHAGVPHAERGWAYLRELELLVESGMTPMEALVAGTMENARFFRIADRLGSVQAGKLADLLLVEGDPHRTLTALRRVARVMLNGRWVCEKQCGER